MHYTILELFALYFCYSFFGWLIETGVASIKNKTYPEPWICFRPFLSGLWFFRRLYDHFFVGFAENTSVPLSWNKHRCYRNRMDYRQSF